MRTSLTTRTAAALAAAALSLPALVGLATPAHAEPTDCTTAVARTLVHVNPTIYNATATVTCATGIGYYRAITDCLAYRHNINSYVPITRTGDWAIAGFGTSSTTTCYGIYKSTKIQFA